MLDAYAIAAQTLVGQALGAGRPDEARATARRVALWGLATGLARRRRCCSRCAPVLLPLFTDDPAVLGQAAVVWWFLAGMQPLAGVVFALDGVLMGAGDVGYLRTVTIGVGGGRLPAAVAAGRAAGLGAGRGVDRADAVHRAAAGRRPRAGGG